MLLSVSQWKVCNSNTSVLCIPLKPWLLLNVQLRTFCERKRRHACISHADQHHFWIIYTHCSVCHLHCYTLTWLFSLLSRLRVCQDLIYPCEETHTKRFANQHDTYSNSHRQDSSFHSTCLLMDFFGVNPLSNDCFIIHDWYSCNYYSCIIHTN